MARICIAMLALLVPAAAHAQWRRCEPPAGIGAAIGLLTLDTPIDPVVARLGRHGLATTTGTGFEGSVHAMAPIAGEWGVTIEAASGRMAVALERDGTGAPVNTPSGDTAAFRRVAAGVLKASGGHRACTYAGFRAGLYRYTYRGTSLNAAGGSAMMGSEFPVSDSGALFFELELSVALTKMRPPLTSDPVAVNIRPVLGFRHRF